MEPAQVLSEQLIHVTQLDVAGAEQHLHHHSNVLGENIRHNTWQILTLRMRPGVRLRSRTLTFVGQILWPSHPG